MNDPLILLLSGIVLILILTFLFWPEKGIFARIRRSRSDSKRDLIENALKFIYDCEYNLKRCHLENLSANINSSIDETRSVITKLERMGLVEARDSNLSLTPEGKTYALRVIRVHRLWEKYLADETSVTETEWHVKAEEVEHHLSSEEADKLAAQLGNPVFDPHGDPIPSASGSIPPKKGKSLNDMNVDEFASIFHIEDEPESTYSQIVAEGLYPGMQVQMIEKDNQRIRFTANGEEVILSPLIAKNISVHQILIEPAIKGKFKTLSSLRMGDKGTVIGIGKVLRGQQRRRLMDLGIVPGTEVEVQLQGFTGDPTAYKVRGTVIALRKEQTDKIYIKDVDGETDE